MGIFATVYLAGAVFWLWLFRLALREEGVFRLASTDDDQHAAEDAADVKLLLLVRVTSYVIVAAAAISVAIFPLNWPMALMGGALLVDASFRSWVRRRAKNRTSLARLK